MFSPHIKPTEVRPLGYQQRAQPVQQVSEPQPVAEHEHEIEYPKERRTIGTVMQTRVLTAHPDWTLGELVKFLQKHRISGAPVTDPQTRELLGLVSQADVVAYLSDRPKPDNAAGFYQMTFGSPELEAPFESQVLVSEIMTPFVYYATEDSGIDEVLDLMLEHHIHRVVVTHHGKLLGLVTTTDLLKFLKSLL